MDVEKVYMQTSYRFDKQPELKLQIRAEHPDKQHSAYVLDIKKGDEGAATLSVEDAKFLRDWLNMVVEKYWAH